MAKDKRGFLMYADQKDLFEELSDEEAGRLIKHIMRYVNDENPEPPDRITKISFTPIKKQLKRDLNAYEEIKSKRAEYGRMGGLAKAKQTVANASISQAKASNTKQTLANVADNDNVNDIVTVNDNEINIINGTQENLQTERGEENTTPEKNEEGLQAPTTKPILNSHVKTYKPDYTSLQNDLQSDITWLTSLCVRCAIPNVEQAKKRVRDWIIHFRTQGEDFITLKEAKSWCSNWLAKQPKEQTNSVNPAYRRR